MSSSTHALVVVVALVAVVVVVCVPETTAADNNQNPVKEPRAARTRREQGKPGTESTTDPNGIPDTEPTTEVTPSCTGTGENECAALTNSKCDEKEKACRCLPPYDVFDDENFYCGRVTFLNHPCEYTSECAAANEYSICNKQKTCVCGEGYLEEELFDFGPQCISREKSDGPGGVDTAMIGVLAGLALMFVIICVVLRLFSKARFRENRSIFNTPNPRLMNASLFKDIDVSGRRGSALSTASATGSTHGQTAPPAGPKTPSPVRETKKAETTVAIETVD